MDLDSYTISLLLLNLPTSLVVNLVTALFLAIAYYYLRDLKHSANIFANISTIFLRFYAQFWMLVSALTAFWGLKLGLEYFFYEIFADSSEEVITENSLEEGAALFFIGSFLIFVHFFIYKLVDRNKRIAATSKLFTALGVMIFAATSFVTMLMLVKSFVTGTDSASLLVSGSQAIATRVRIAAGLVAALAFWCVYVLNSVMTYFNEKRKAA